MQTRKHTSWKKNRKFGHIKGGRRKLKCEDGIFNKLHSFKFKQPAEYEEKPFFYIDNPSRDFYFPITVDEIKTVLERLPQEHTKHLTHIWLRKIKRVDYLNDDSLQGCFVAGSGVFLIILYPFPKDNRMIFGKKKPLQKTINSYKKYTIELNQDNAGYWYLQWDNDSIKKYYLENLLLHEIGHSIDSFYQRFWSKCVNASKESFASEYVSFWGATLRESYEDVEDAEL